MNLVVPRSIISPAQTNKYLHDLAFTQTIWISLVDDLRKRGFVDRLSAADIQKMSTQSLVAVVRRLVVRPDAWSPPRIQHPKSPPPKSFAQFLHNIASPRRTPGTLGSDPPQAQMCVCFIHRFVLCWLRLSAQQFSGEGNMFSLATRKPSHVGGSLMIPCLEPIAPQSPPPIFALSRRKRSTTSSARIL